MLTLLTSYQWKDRKMKFDDFLSEIDDRKERKKENILSTSVLVPKNEGAKVARYVVRRQLISYLHRHVANAPSDQGNVQLYRKIP